MPGFLSGHREAGSNLEWSTMVFRRGDLHEILGVRILGDYLPTKTRQASFGINTLRTTFHYEIDDEVLKQVKKALRG